MQFRRRSIAISVAAVISITGGFASASPGGVAQSVRAPSGFVVRGVGYGHGRGLSQWGSYGRSLQGQNWMQILDAYYGGTQLGSVASGDIRVRLGWADNRSTVGVISQSSAVQWSGSTASYGSIYATETGGNTFDVYGSGSVACPGADALVIPRVELRRGSGNSGAVAQLQTLLNALGYGSGVVDGSFGVVTEGAVRKFEQDVGLTPDGVWSAAEADAAAARIPQSGTVQWHRIATGVTGPIRFNTTVNQSTAAPGAVLGLCGNTGAVTHYRGQLELIDTSDGNRVVNQLNIENYLRGVVPKESPPSWGDSNGGAGMEALRAQSVAARSYALSQDRYSYAQTCETPSCQVYGGAATRGSAAVSSATAVEHRNTDRAIADTAGRVRVWPDGSIVSTEFSSSNGPRTAGGAFAPIDDPFDDVRGNKRHRWSRFYSAAEIAAGLGADATKFGTRADQDSLYDGIWANEVVLKEGQTMSAWDFRNALDLPSPGFVIVPVTCLAPDVDSMAFIGDSIGVGVAGEPSADLRAMLSGAFDVASFDAVANRQTSGGRVRDGVSVAGDVPVGTDLVVVELGYNDDPGDPQSFVGEIDQMMTVLEGRGVGEVLWVNMSQRRPEYGALNSALQSAAGRWSQLSVLDWQAASGGPLGDRWFADDNVHLESSGRAEFSLWLHDRIAEATGANPAECATAAGVDGPRHLGAGEVLHVPVLGRFGVPATLADVAAVALNVTAFDPAGPGFLRVWECGQPEPPTSAVNFVAAGTIEPNAVIVPLSKSGEVCVRSLVDSHVFVDVSAWFDTAAQPAAGRVIDTRLGGRLAGSSIGDDGVLEVEVLGQYGIPVDRSKVAAVALNITAVAPVGPGFLRVWECGSAEPETSTVNYVHAAAIEPNAAVVAFSDDGDGKICIRSLVDTDVVVDVVGWFDAAAQSGTARLVDTRQSNRVSGSNPGDSAAVLRVAVRGRGGVASSDAAAIGVALNVTAVGPDDPGFLRVWACDRDEPDTSSVNFTSAGSIEPNAVVVSVPADGSGEICVRSLTTTDVLVDLTGWFDDGVNPASGRLIDTRSDTGLIRT